MEFKKVSEIEYAGLDFIQGKFGGSAKGPISLAIKELAVGEAFILPTEYWADHKSHPSSTALAAAQRMGMTLQTRKLADGSGWAIKRTA